MKAHPERIASGFTELSDLEGTWRTTLHLAVWSSGTLLSDSRPAGCRVTADDDQPTVIQIYGGDASHDFEAELHVG